MADKDKDKTKVDKEKEKEKEKEKKYKMFKRKTKRRFKDLICPNCSTIIRMEKPTHTNLGVREKNCPKCDTRMVVSNMIVDAFV